jgi:asparagine synthase (glutamine-hydrolysing)
MCGIAGIYRRRGFRASDASRLTAMTDAIFHRGPDDFGYLLGDSRQGHIEIGQGGFAPGTYDVLLGHRRLSIIDLSVRGRQPLHNEARDVFIVFNGEIYNHIELKQTLAARGHQFVSATDTEVIVHAYEEWGEDCVGRFNGMWALAIWNQRTRELFCSRDRFGVKPFYYFLTDDVFIFASEIKAILPALDGCPSPDGGVIYDYLLRGELCHGPETFFEGIKRLEPAHNLTISGNSVKKQRYWNYRTQSHEYDYTRPVDTFKELFHDAVTLRLRSDVPVGMALSGGLDSTSVLAAARKNGRDAIKSFSAVFPGYEYDESHYAQLAARHLGSELLCIDYKPYHLVNELERVIWYMDYPALFGQILSRWEIMRLASRHVKVILEGQGGDELLAGYLDRYFGHYALDEICHLKRGQFVCNVKELAASTRRMYRCNGLAPYYNLVKDFAARFNFRLTRPTVTRRAVTREKAFHASPTNRTLDRPFEHHLNNALYHDHAQRILPMLLKFGDAISMAFSMEARVPFLDYRLVEFVFALPYYQKFSGSTSKWLLREALQCIVPQEILTRKDKVGFVTPDSQWLKKCIESEIKPLLLSDRTRARKVFDVEEMSRLLNKYMRGQIDISHYVFRWVSIELWYRLYIDGDGASKYLCGLPGK